MNVSSIKDPEQCVHIQNLHEHEAKYTALRAIVKTGKLSLENVNKQQCLKRTTEKKNIIFL